MLISYLCFFWERSLFLLRLFACFFFKTVSYLDFYFSDKAPCPEAAWGAYGSALSSHSITDVSQSRNSGRKWEEELKQRRGGVVLMGLLSLLSLQDNSPGSGTTHMICASVLPQHPVSSTFPCWFLSLPGHCTPRFWLAALLEACCHGYHFIFTYSITTSSCMVVSSSCLRVLQSGIF